MTDIQKKLIELSDKDYAAFQSALMPTVKAETVIGVRLPALRKFAKDFYKTSECDDFIHTLPHTYYDENMLHSVLLGYVADFEKATSLCDGFLPYIDNWAVCDTLRPKGFSKEKEKLIIKIKEWISSDKIYTCRFGIKSLMENYLDDGFKPEYNETVAAVTSDDYYIRMAVAWYFATALAFVWDETIVYIEHGRLPVWIHNKTIQKAIESYRITDMQKEYLRKMRIK